MNDARTIMLNRIRGALGTRAGGPSDAWDPDTETDPLATYLRTRSVSDTLDLLRERIEEFGAPVTVVSGGSEVGTAVASICARHEAPRIAVPAGVRADWTTGLPKAVSGDELTARELDGLDGVLTGCAVAIADTGTIVLDGGADQGPRRLTLVPDLHVCVVRASQVVTSVPEAIGVLRRRLEADRRPLTMISGPSATSDIEFDRVEGVHGPRRLEVLILEAE